MVGEEEEDPDWLRAFQAPTTSMVMLSSGSDDSPENSPTRTAPAGEEKGGGIKASSEHAGDGDVAAQNKGKMATRTRRKTPSSQEDAFDKDEGPTIDGKQAKPAKRSTPKKNLVKLPSDSNSSPGNNPSRTGETNKEEDSLNTSNTKHGQQVKGKKTKVTGLKAGPDQIDDTLEQQEDGVAVAEEDVQDKLTEHSVSQRLPLIIPDKVQRTKALIECDGDSIDLSGDIGAVGRIVISNSPNGNQDLLLDLKGTVYKSTIVPSRTFCVVSVGQTEAKIEAIMNDFIQLEPQSNLFEAETMMEGTLDGFTFDSDEEGDKLLESHASQNDQNNEDEDQPKAKNKRKAEKPLVKGQKKAKAKVAGKAAKKGTRKTQITKRTKKAKK
ncbi:DNA-binding protein BIN4 [Oryza brachyantha]|uniref:DNA-binding protein BIN4 n=1 Tax=Oryza brachyantha TaxID=4533 RepID=J3L9J8_ORYBR|nr:DNA-binding protein BIN4 [Oryza brachyantha]